jgi:hypothetical protein
MKQKLIPCSIAAYLVVAATNTPSAHAAITATGTYDELTIQANAVDFNMAYSGNATWTTGIGQTLGSSQIIAAAAFIAQVEAAATVGMGGVIDFDNGSLDSTTSLTVNFAANTKSLSLTNRAENGGSYSIGTDISNRTPISGTSYLGRSGTPHFDFDFGGFTGFDTAEKITAVGVTLLGRNGTGGNSNWRVIGFYTNGTDSGSSSTFRTLNTNTGNATNDSFSGIAAPDGYWLTRIRIHSDNNVFTSIDDLAFVTSIVPEPSTTLLGGLGALALLRRRRR